jgi:hypothetical protein
MTAASPFTAQYFAAQQALSELLQLRATNWSPAIGHQPIRASCLALAARTGELLASGDQTMPYPESEPAAKAAHFARDLDELLGLTNAIGDEVLTATHKLASE